MEGGAPQTAEETNSRKWLRLVDESLSVSMLSSPWFSIDPFRKVGICAILFGLS